MVAILYQLRFLTRTQLTLPGHPSGSPRNEGAPVDGHSAETKYARRECVAGRLDRENRPEFGKNLLRQQTAECDFVGTAHGID